MISGVRLGVDVGSVRVGVACSDADGALATPLVTVPRDDAAVAAVAELVASHAAVEVIVGLPLSLKGGETASTSDARRFAAALAERTGADVRLLDERLTTVSAQSALRASGRSTRTSRSIVDQVAAVVLLQSALDQERRTGRAAGDRAAHDPENQTHDR